MELRRIFWTSLIQSEQMAGSLCVCLSNENNLRSTYQILSFCY